ncbi:hypothetical protein Bca4012_058288 [Brassica carinata]|uniref:Protein BZR1 homolog n=1 Tax=Brassica carinata TaxID=52824 RepID=A0A8X7W302_BRACI|nr:hypothetical protein Bca52824_016027 [Brassica carinata]
MTSGTRMPTWRERENNKRRERRRRAIAAKIFTGLRMYGNYELPKHCDNNEVLKALCNEAGWIVEQDGTTYRKGSSRPVERMEIGIGSATTSPCASYNPSPCSSYANLTTGDGQSLIPWLKHLSTTTSANNYLYIPGGSISAPVTPPLSSPTARMNPDHRQQQINNSFFVSSTPPSPTRQQTVVPDSEWFSGIQLAQSVPASPTFSLVSQNPFGIFKEAGDGGGGSRMWTPGQSGTCSPAFQTGDVPMSDTVVAPPPEFAFGSNTTNGLVKAWEGERIHEESGSDDLELTLGNSSTKGN